MPSRSRTHLRPPAWWLTAAWAAAALGIVAWWAPARLGFPFLCPLRTLTGIPCPTCGATRTVALLIQLRPAEAFRCNPLVAILGVCLASVCAVATPLWLMGRLPEVGIGKRGLGRLRVAVAVAVLVNWLYLLLALR